MEIQAKAKTGGNAGYGYITYAYDENGVKIANFKEGIIYSSDKKYSRDTLREIDK